VAEGKADDFPRLKDGVCVWKNYIGAEAEGLLTFFVTISRGKGMAHSVEKDGRP